MKHVPIINPDKPKFKDFKDFVLYIEKQYADNEAFILKKKVKKEVSYTSIKYTQFADEIKCVATSLLNRGFEGKRIAIIGNNSYNWLVAYYASLSGVGTVVPLDKSLPFEEVKTSIERCEADVIFFDKTHADNVKKLAEDGSTTIKLFASLDDIEGVMPITDLLEEGRKLREEGNKDYEAKTIDPHDTTIMLFTSGTTSMSKIVLLTQDNVLENIHKLQLCQNLYETDRNLALLPFHHTFGSTGTLLMLASGMSTAFCDGLKYISKNLVEYKISVFFCVPLLIESIYKKVLATAKKDGKEKLLKTMLKVSNFLLKFGIDLRKKFFASVHKQLGGNLRLLITGASAIDKEALETFLALGITAFQGYGLTETSPVLTCEALNNLRLGSVGKPLPTVELKIVGADANGVGEVFAKGPNVTCGYYQNPEATENAFDEDGFFNTGDLGYIDEDGYLFLCGRSKNVIVLKNGKNIYPEEIELLIANLPYVAENMVFGMPKNDDVNDLIMGVKIVVNKEYIKEHYADLSEDEIKKMIDDDIDQINQQMPAYKHLHRLIVTDKEMIKTSTAKVKRHEEIKVIMAEYK